MTKTLRLALLASAFLGLATLSAAAGELEAVEKKICAAHEKHKSMTAKMTMSVSMNVGNLNLQGQGTGTYEFMRKGEKLLSRVELEKTTLQTLGDEEKGRTEQQMTTIVDGEFSYTVSVTKVAGHEEPQTSAVKNRIDPKTSGDPKLRLAALRQEGTLKLLPEETVDGHKVFVIEVTPTESPKGPVAASRTVYRFRQDSGFLVNIVSYDPAGQPATEMSWSDVKLDVELDPERFVFRPPMGVPVRDKTRGKP